MLVESYKAYVREGVANLVGSETSLFSPQLAGFVIDMFCTTMIDVANEFGQVFHMMINNKDHLTFTFKIKHTSKL